jgi:tyrosine-protein phosphatase YwqE
VPGRADLLLLPSADSLHASSHIRDPERQDVDTVNLTVVLAQLGRDVLLVDGGLQSRAYTRCSRLNRSELVNYLSNPEALFSRSGAQPCLTPAGPIAEPAELLASSGCAVLAPPRTLRLRHHRQPPALPVTDPRSSFDNDGVVLCVGKRRAPDDARSAASAPLADARFWARRSATIASDTRVTGRLPPPRAYVASSADSTRGDDRSPRSRPPRHRRRPGLALERAMAWSAPQDGTRTWPTPHQRHASWPNGDRALLERLLAELRAAVGERAPRLELGAEISVDSDLLREVDRLPQGPLVSLAGSRYLLLELPWQPAAEQSRAIVHELLVAGWWPIIAHAERYTWLSDDPAQLIELHDLGAQLQITAMSLTGGFGRKAQTCAEFMLDHGLADLGASDARPRAAADRVGGAAGGRLALGRHGRHVCSKRTR